MIGACTGFNENVSEVVYGLDGYDATMAGMKNLTWIHRNQNALTDIFSFFLLFEIVHREVFSAPMKWEYIWVYFPRIHV